MRYGVRKMTLGKYRFVELTETEYSDASSACKCLICALCIEEKFRLLLDNYAEFEEELLRLTNQYSIFGDTGLSLRGDMSDVSRRLINFIATARLYVDQVKHDISGLYGKDSQQSDAVKRAFSSQYDTLSGYRAMEELRNFAQHRNLPLDNIRYDGTRISSKSGDLRRYICTPAICIEEIEVDRKFKRKILEEMKIVADKNKKVYLKPLVREYMTGLATVHAAVRELIDADVNAAETTFDTVVQKFKDEHGDDTLGIALVEEDPDGMVKSTAYLVSDIIAHRNELAWSPRDLRQQFVSSQSIADIDE